MTEVILGLIVLASLGLNGWLIYRYQEQEKTFITALLSKNVEEFAKAEVKQKVEPKKKKEPVTPDEFVPVTDLSDEQFERVIKKEVDGKK